MKSGGASLVYRLLVLCDLWEKTEKSERHPANYAPSMLSPSLTGPDPAIGVCVCFLFHKHMRVHILALMWRHRFSVRTTCSCAWCVHLRNVFERRRAQYWLGWKGRCYQKQNFAQRLSKTRQEEKERGSKVWKILWCGWGIFAEWWCEVG